MAQSEIAERIAARRAELDGLEELLVKQLEEVRSERDELAVAERVWLAAVQGVGGPISTKQVGQELGLDTVTPGKLEPLRGKLSKHAERGWLHKLPDGRFTARP